MLVKLIWYLFEIDIVFYYGSLRITVGKFSCCVCFYFWGKARVKCGGIWWTYKWSYFMANSPCLSSVFHAYFWLIWLFCRYMDEKWWSGWKPDETELKNVKAEKWRKRAGTAALAMHSGLINKLVSWRWEVEVVVPVIGIFANFASFWLSEALGRLFL